MQALNPEYQWKCRKRKLYFGTDDSLNLHINIQVGNDNNFTEYDEVYLGHTPTIRYGIETPMKCREIWMMDTGAGWWGKLTIINTETKEYFQSDKVTELYPDEKGRSA